MKQIIGVLLIVAALAFGWDGIQKFQDSTASVKILGIKINAEDKGGQQTAAIELVLAAIALAGGIYLLRGSKT